MQKDNNAIRDEMNEQWEITYNKILFLCYEFALPSQEKKQQRNGLILLWNQKDFSQISPPSNFFVGGVQEDTHTENKSVWKH